MARLDYHKDIMHDVSKRQRQNILREVIAGKAIGDQVHLRVELKRRGIEATQATVSRDLQELGVVKARVGRGFYRYELGDKPSQDVLWAKLTVLFKNFVLGLNGTGNLLLIKTSPGNANGVASFIDRIGIEEVLGTIAGDDTILVVVDTVPRRKRLEAKLAALVGAKA
jgi:transcriptional regulator of arginine metabolism